MAEPKHPKEIYAISEADFWSRLDVPAATAGADTLAEAIRLGRAGKKTGAYVALAEFHRAARGDSWQMAVEMAGRRKLLNAAQAGRLLRQPLGKLDGSGLPGDEVRNLSVLMHRVQPLVHRVTLKGGDAATRAFLANVLKAVYRCRKSLHADSGGYPLYTMLPAHGQFHFFWWTYLALLHTGPVPTGAAEAAMKLIMGLGRTMQQQTARYIVHNIYTAACYGLFFLARTMVEFTEAAAWEEQALRSLDLDFDRAFYPDGGHLERNWGYGSYTLERLTHTWQFAMRTGGMGGREEHFLAGLRRAYRFFAATLDARDTGPGFGDEGLMDLGHILDRAVEKGVFPAGTPRDLGMDRSRSCLMEGSGVAVMRNGGDPAAAWADVTFGEYAGWHSHMDLLSMNLRSRGRVLLQEAPRFGPYEHPMDVLWRAPEAHNQLLVDSFLYDSRPCVGQDVFWHSDDVLDFFSACHAAYRLVPPMEHRTHHQSADLVVRRTIAFVKDPGYVLVLDSVQGEGSGRFNRATSCWWHSPQRFRALGQGLARTAGSPGCLLVWARPETIRRLETGTDYTPEEVGQSYHQVMDQSHYLRARTWMPAGHDGCLGFATVLFPFQRKAPEVAIRPLPLKGCVLHRAEAFEVLSPAGRDVFVLNPEKLPDVSFRGRPVAGRALIRAAKRKGAIEIH